MKFRGVYTGFTLSVRPSVCGWNCVRQVSPEMLTDPFQFYTSYQSTNFRMCVSCSFIFNSKIWMIVIKNGVSCMFLCSYVGLIVLCWPCSLSSEFVVIPEMEQVWFCHESCLNFLENSIKGHVCKTDMPRAIHCNKDEKFIKVITRITFWENIFDLFDRERHETKFVTKCID